MTRRVVSAAAAALVGYVALFGSTDDAFAVADSKASRYYEDALGRYEKRDLPGAIIQLKNALQIDRGLLPVQTLLGRALLGNGEAAAAEVALMEALRLGVNRAEVVLPLAQAYIAQGKQKQLADQPLLSPAGLPNGVRLPLLLLRAAAFADIGDARAALADIDAARAIDAQSADVWLAEVPIRIRARQFREAAAAVDRALVLAPASAEAWYQKGAVLHVQGDLRGALASYDKALAFDAKHVESHIARAGLLIDLGQFADAAKAVAEVKKLSPREPRAAYLRGLLAERDGNPAATRAAMLEITQLVDPVPVDFIRFRPLLLLLNGMAHFGLGEREKAKPYLELLQRVQVNSAASKLLAQIYLSEPNIPRAIEVLESYLKAQPADGQALVLLAGAHLSQGRNARATALMQEALRSNDSPAFRTVLGLSLIGSGQAAGGLAQLETAYKKDPGQTQAAAALVTAYLRSGQAAKAVAVAGSLVKRQPASPAYLNLLGMARARAADLAGARSAFEQALKVDASLLPVQLNIARLDTNAGAFDAAATRLNALLKANERSADTLYEMAMLADRRGQAAEAQRWLEKADAQEGPRQLRSGLALIELQLRNRQPALALAAARRLNAKAPDDVQGLLAYSRAQLAVGDAAGARSTLGNATRLADFDARLQVEISGLQLAAKNLPGATYSLEKALSGNPDDLAALALMTDIDLQQGDLARAEQRARKVSELGPKRAVGYSLQGDVALARGRPAAALDAYRRAHQVEPSAETLLRLFRALSANNAAAESVAMARQWIAAHPSDFKVQAALADAYARAGNFASARASYEAVLKVSPDDASALNNLANVLLRLKDPGAVKVAERALAQDPGNAFAIDTLGWALFQNGDPERALQLLRDARLREPENADIRYHLAAVLAGSGRMVEARAELDVAFKSGRSFESSGDAASLQRTLR